VRSVAEKLAQMKFDSMLVWVLADNLACRFHAALGGEKIGDVSSFLNTTQQTPFLFDDIRSLLDQQFQRLTELEKSILYWLAINREAILLNHLQMDFVTTVPAREVLESLNSLHSGSAVS
jgi:hypothetical protein